MEQNFYEYSLLALWALIVGAFLCAVYDVFRVFRLEKRQNSVLLFFTDVAFSLICAFSMLLLFFNLSHGKMRLYAFAFALAGFLIWRFTFSRLYISIIKRLILITERFLRYIKNIVRSALHCLWRYVSTYFYCRSTARAIARGKIFKIRKEVKNVTEKNGKDQPGH